jgi:hypothetical protein
VLKLSPGTFNPSNLARIKKNYGLELDYQTGLKEVKNKGDAEILRANLVKEVCMKIGGGGGSDDELEEKIRNINREFINALK